MTWPEAFYKVVTEGGGALVSVAVLLYLFTGFWETMFCRPKKDLPDRVVKVAEEIRKSAKRITAKQQETVTNLQLYDWADRILLDTWDVDDEVD